MDNNKTIKALKWIPSLYFAEALPYMMVMMLSSIMYANMGLSNTQLALYTSWLYLPWVIKPLWSPVIDCLRTKRWWIITMQALLGVSLAGIAFSINTSFWLQLTLAFFWLMAFNSASHDIAADGMYILALDQKEQAFYVGWRSTFYRIGSIFCQGALVVLAGTLEKKYNVRIAWATTMGIAGGIMFLLSAWHYITIPRVEGTSTQKPDILQGVWDSLRTFMSKPRIVTAMLFMLLFRLPEAQLAKMAQPFMLRSISEGGLALDTDIIGYTYGTLGVIGLLLGGIVGGWLVSRDGLKRWWWPMVMAISLPDAVYIYLAMFQPDNLWTINGCVFLEQLGYGFGFTAYMLFLVYFAKGEKSTSVFSICTAFQALGMMIPGMFAGWIADSIGFVNFFWWVMGCCLVTVFVSAIVRIKE